MSSAKEQNILDCCGQDEKKVFSIYCVDGKRYCESCVRTKYILVCENCKENFNANYRFFNHIQRDLCDSCYQSQCKKENDQYDENKKNIKSLLKEFCKMKPRFKDSILVEDAKQFEELKQILKTHPTSEAWAAILIGQHEKTLKKFSPIFLKPDQMVELNKMAEDICGPENNPYKFVHALAPHALLIKEICNHGLYRYYAPGKTKEDIFRAWSFDQSFAFNAGIYKLDNCAICMEDITTSHKSDFVECSKCGQYSHYQCKMKMFLTKNKTSCELCRFQYVKDDDLLLTSAPRIYRQMAGQNSMKLWTWKDHLESFKQKN